jgi:voltage-gated potassium channel Kch/Trk K+ transport system NAD-binding subunit
MAAVAQARTATTAQHLESATLRSSALRWMDRWVDAPLLLLAASAVPLLIVETGNPTPGDHRVLTAVNWLVWAAFTLNFIVRLALAYDRREELRSLAWDVGIILLQPTLLFVDLGLESGATLLRLVVVGGRVLSKGSVLRRASQLLSRHPLRVVAGVVPFLWLTSAALGLRLESGNGSVQSIGDSLWWGAATLTTVGYGDVSPASAAGRAVAVGTMITGIGMFSVVTAKLAEALLVRRTTRSRSHVLEEGHLLVLGFSPKVFTVVDEMVVANDRRDDPVVVVLADADPDEVIAAVEAHVPALRVSNTRLEVRRGSPVEPADIALTRPGHASAVIIVEDGNEEASVVKSSLALLNCLGPDSTTPVVTEIDDPAAAEALRQTFPDRIIVVEPNSFIARVTAQSCRAPGVALAYEELMSFQGSEFYVRRQPGAAGHQFVQLAASFDDACVVGLRSADGTIKLNPPGSTVVADSDELIVIAVDEHTITWMGASSEPPPPLPEASTAREDESIAIFGWSPLGPALLVELDRYVTPGSTVTIAVRERTRAAVEAAVPKTLEAARVELRSALGAKHPALVAAVSSSTDHAIILCDRDCPISEADAHSLVTMMQVRQAIERGARDRGRGHVAVSVITELRDERDVELAPRTSMADFIVSERLVSLVLAQLAENHALAGVFEELLDAEGSELYVKPVTCYVALDEPTTFGRLARAVAQRDEVAVGYRRAAALGDPDGRFGVEVNPSRTTTFVPATGDQVIVIAEEPD